MPPLAYTRCVLSEISDGASEGTDQPGLVFLRHTMVRGDHRLIAIVAQAGGRIIQCHGACQPEALRDANIGCHSHTPIDGPAATLSTTTAAFKPTEG